MSITVYTSCASNYLAKACALADSLRRESTFVHVVLVLCDNVANAPREVLKRFDEVWSPADLGYDAQWIFQHNVMELCTAVKGRALLRALEQDSVTHVCYLDPDVYLYEDVRDLISTLEHGSIGLVPHLTRPAMTDIEFEMTERSVLEHGTYNLGHLLVRNDDIGRAFAFWWASRLDSYCYDDRQYGIFTDQRWADPVPAFFPNVQIIKHPGINVASWNLAGKQLRPNGGGWLIDGEPLISYHFSGADDRGVHHAVRAALFPDSPNAVVLEHTYLTAIADRGQAQISDIPFAHGFFESGRSISQSARVIYRNASDLKAVFPDPFRSGADTYEDWLLNNRPDAIAGFALAPTRQRRAWLELFDSDHYEEQLRSAGVNLDGDAETHYKRIGSRLGLDPCRWFSTEHYRMKLLARGLSPTYRTDWLSHYLLIGLKEGIDPLPYFNSQWYLASYADVREAVDSGVYATPLAHFATAGHGEDRSPSEGFRSREMLLRNPDVAEVVRVGTEPSAAAAMVSRWRTRHLSR